jgi:hypothetical protein
MSSNYLIERGDLYIVSFIHNGSMNVMLQTMNPDMVTEIGELA